MVCLLFLDPYRLSSALVILHILHSASSQCGVPTVMTRIVGGHPVPSMRYPWYVALVAPSGSSTLSVSCGGSLITSRHVLTAAHCFPTSGGRPEDLYQAVFNLLDRCDATGSQSMNIARVELCPSFNSQTLLGDVAVATLQAAVPYTPICLPPRNSMVTGQASIIGFGSTLAKANAQSQYPCTLQEARINILTKRQCTRSALPPDYSRIPGTICAGLLKGGVDSCDGDSGGPLQTVGPSGAYTIQGIVSFGEGCARKNLPGVYTQVSAYRDFIDKATRSSSGFGSASSPGDFGIPRPVPPQRPLTPLQVFLQGLFPQNRRAGRPPGRPRPNFLTAA